MSVRASLAAVWLLALPLAACGGGADENNAGALGPVEAAGSVVDILASDSSFATLATAVESAGLAERLGGEGEFTVFAPTDDAFGKLATAPEGEALAKALSLHVVDGVLDAETLILAIEEAGEDGHRITTLGGAALTATRADGPIVLTDPAGNQALIEATDVEASNGVIHVIDAVLLP